MLKGEGEKEESGPKRHQIHPTLMTGPLSHTALQEKTELRHLIAMIHQISICRTLVIIICHFKHDDVFLL